MNNNRIYKFYEVAGYFIEFVNAIIVHLIILVIPVPDSRGLCLKITLLDEGS